MTLWDLYLDYVFHLDPVLHTMGRVNGVTVSVERQQVLREKIQRELVDLQGQAQAAVPVALCPTVVWKKRPLERPTTEIQIPGSVRVCSACGAQGVSAAAHFKGSVTVTQVTNKKGVTKDKRTRVKNPCKALGGAITKRPGLVPAWLETLPFNPLSGPQLMAYARHFKHPLGRHMKTGQPTVDKKHLKKLEGKYGAGHPIYTIAARMRVVNKVLSTFVDGFAPDASGRIYGTYKHAPATFRLCIAAGTPVDVLRDVQAHPAGIPIENVKAGDWAYTFDANRQLTLRRVTWAAKTGHKQVVRVHWRAQFSRYGYTDMTPDHRVRLVDGSYKPAGDLVLGDRVLAMARGVSSYGYARMWPTGHDEIPREHRFVWSQLVDGDVPEHIHHINGNKLDNRPENLEGLTNSAHQKRHNNDETWTPERRERQRKVFEAYWSEHERSTPTGKSHPHWRKDLTKEKIESALWHCGGQPTRVAEFLEIGYTTLQRRLVEYGIDPKEIREHFNMRGERITQVLVDDARGARTQAEAREIAGLGWHRWKAVQAEHGYVPYNHKIIAVEPLTHAIDVYDLEIDETHNFIANEICVHNSQSSVNLMQVSHREEAVYAEDVRRTIIPRPGHVFVEADSSAIEAVMTGYFCGDPGYMALAKAGVHAYLCCLELGWDFTDENIRRVKKEHKAMYARKKQTVHGSSYGMGPGLMAANYPHIFANRREAEAEQQKFFTACPTIPKWWAEIKYFAYRNGRLTNPWGLSNYFGQPLRRDGDRVVDGEDADKAVAFLPQSSAAMFMRENLRLLAKDWLPYMPANGVCHDSYLLDVPAEREQDAIDALVRVLTRPIPQMQGLQIGCEVGTSAESWADMTTVKVVKV